LLLLGAVMALRLPRAMQCEGADAVELPAQRDAAESRVSV
jgi:DHA2 family multidrug resistance protein-like MFS transporter